MILPLHLTVLLGCVTLVSGFHVALIPKQNPGSYSIISHEVESPFQRRVSLNMAFGDYFNNAFNSTGFLNVFSGKREETVTSSRNDDIDEDSEDENEYLGSSNIFSIDVDSIKVGGCRLYLSLYFMGEMNNPERGSWRTNQSGDGGIDLYYKDRTGALLINFSDDVITVNRLGSSPSMEYLMQESNILNGMLDQLDEIAHDSSIDKSDRLLSLRDENGIQEVRETLAFT